MTVLAGATVMGTHELAGMEWISLSACEWELIHGPVAALGAREIEQLRRGERPRDMPTCPTCLVLLDACLSEPR
ncbi:MAG: hypothetical protein QM723_06830 [Myxococcaceae bacterium]